MSARFLPFDELVDRLAEQSFETPPAVVSNAHVTGLGVARALDRHDVPVIALDRTPDGVAPGSEAVDFAGKVTYPLADLDGYRRDLEQVAAALSQDPVAFGCMDEWVHALAETAPEGVRLPFAADRIDGVLDKTALYARCEEFSVPYPETYRIEEAGTESGGPSIRSAEAAAQTLGFPLVCKPARKRAFEEVLGTNVVEVSDREQYRDVVAQAEAGGVRLMAQERVDVAVGEDRSLASYVSPEGDVTAVLGNARARYPPNYGTSCVVDRVESRSLRERALQVLDAAGYHGISESEFVYDRDRETYVLLDVNTRPWKWIGMPVAAGANLPMAAYASAVEGVEYTDSVRPDEQVRWVYLADYLKRLADGGADVLSQAEWLALARGEVHAESGTVTGVYDPLDPEPAYQLLQTELTDREYYCAC